MSTYGSQTRLPTMSRRTNSRPDLSSPSFTYSRTEGNAGGNGFYPEMMDGSNTIYYTKTISGGHGGGHGGVQSIHQKAQFLQSQFKEYLNKAEFSLQSGGAADADRFLEMSSVVLEQLQGCGIQLEQMGQPSDSIMRNVDQCRDQLRVIHFSMNGQAPPQRKNRGGSIGHDGGRAFHEAMAWIAQQKRLVETAPWGDDQATIEQQITKHSKFHSAIQRSPEVERARIELEQKGERSFRHALDQEWDSLQKMSCSRSNQLRDLSKIIEDISREIIWVNEREEEELVFDWGDKDIDNYIPKKQESYSRLMRDLEEKEKDLNKLNQKVENLMKNNHPASDKIEAYKDTLQTQWSWLLQITKCIDTHLKENAAYSQFFKEANETYGKLQKEHENIRKKFTCDKGTSLEMLMELIKNLQKEKEVIMENKRQVQHLVNKSKSIVRLKPRNTHEKSGSPVIVKALCDFKQDQKQILKGNEAILKDNTQRSKWHVTGPGGLDMLIPSVCLLVPPPNPLSISLANKNEQYFEAIMGIWNQLFINIKSLISWRYCLQDIERINSLTITMLAKMRPDEYRKILKSLETRYQEFMRSCVGSEMFADEDKVQMERQYTGAQDHYDKLVVQLPTYNSAGQQVQVETIQRPTQTVLVSTQPPRPVSSVLISSKTTTTNVSQSPTSPPPNKGSSTPVPSPTPSSSQSLQSLTLLSELHALRQKLELAESGLTQHIHVPLGENSVHECSQRMLSLEQIHQNIDSIRDEHVRLREKILIQLEGMKDMDKAKFLRTELNLINQKIGSLEGFSTNYIQRLKSLQALQQSLLQAEDIIKVHEARLTEKETSSLEPRELEDYRAVLKRMKQDLDQKRDVLKKLEMELGNTEHWNNQISQSFHKCDVDLSRYREQVTQMIDRWRRMQTQIDTRMWDLEKQQQQLKNYKQTSSQVNSWIGDVQQRQDSLLSKKFNDLKTLTEHLNQQKMLYSEIKGKKDKVDDVVRDAHTCASSIADYEVELASYSAGLETLLNIPIKRTMLQSPTAIVREEAIDIQSRYIELFTRSGDYYKFLGDLQKNMEELKMSNTRIELLEEELRRLKEEAQDRAQKNRSLEDSLSRYQLELSQSKDQLLSMEEVKRTQALQCSAAKDNLDSTYSQVKDLDDKVTRLTYALDEEKRKRRLAEERYTNQQDEYDLIVRKRQKELDDVSRSKLEIEKTIKEKEREIERLRMQLEDEEARRRTSESELSKSSGLMHESQTRYKDLLQEKETLLLRIKTVEQEKGRAQKNEDELSRIRLSLESEMRQKQHLQDELDQLRKDFNYWKSQYELKDGLLRQCDTDKGKAERELSSLRSEIERLAAELRAVEERYKGRLQSSEREVSELTRIREDLERQLQQLRMRLVELESRTVVDHSATITSAVPSKSVSNTTTTTTTVTTKKTSGKDMKVPGIRGEVTITELVESNLLDDSDVRKIEEGLLTSEDIENKLKTYLHGSDCIAGIFDEKKNRTLPIYQAMKEGLLRPGTTLELLEAQAASGFMIDPINNLLLTVEEAWKRNLIGREFKAKLMSAERAVTGYNDPRTGKIISLFQAMEKGIIEKGHGIRLLEAQIASGGIIDPKESHRIDVDVAYRRGYFDEEMNEILSYEGDDTKGFFDPNTEENLTYLQLKERCITDEKTGLVLLPLWDKSKSRQQGKSSQKNTLRKRRVVIVDPDTQKEMTVREAYHRELIDYDTFLELSEQECEWEEITITAPDGSTRLVVVDRKTGKQYDIQDYLDRGLLSQKSVDQYRSGALTLTEFADQILNKSNMELSITSTSAEDVATCSSPTQLRPSSPTARKRFSSISITLSPASEILDDLSPIAAIFDTETVEKITIPEAHRRGIVDTITAQRLLEAQACTGGIINPGNGQRLTLQDAVHQGIIDEDMAAKLKPAQKAFQGFEDVKTKRKMSAAEAMKEKWLPHEAGQRFLEFQYLTGGLIEPGTGQKVSIEEAIKRNWLEGREARKLQDTRLYIKNLTCPKTKLKISYKEALDNCMVEENNGMKMIQATSISSKGISSPYNVRSNSGSRSGSRAGSRTGSRRGSVDLTTSSAFSFSSSSFSSSAFS
ncbi:desmoplakin isoform X2 [Anguilla anguilla]|uniref:desmoplakin isoform X2 n=1 Tax=Anguilla anguilla TaxID=7936 RepID=UPI0015AD4A30|nr:desmoplakin isoform X2 [Anguilla anguilla]